MEQGFDGAGGVGNEFECGAGETVGRGFRSGSVEGKECRTYGARFFWSFFPLALTDQANVCRTYGAGFFLLFSGQYLSAHVGVCDSYSLRRILRPRARMAGV